MLILTRRINQGVRLYDEEGRYVGHIKVLDVDGDRVKMGFEVDTRFVLLRNEIVDSAATERRRQARA